MPSLVLFGRRTLVAGDDLCIYSGVSFVVRLLQLAFAIALISQVGDHIANFQSKPSFIARCLAPTEAENWGNTIYVYLGLSIFLCVVGLGVEIMVYIISGRGTPTQPEKRAPLKLICHVNFSVLFVLKVMTVLVGISSAHVSQKFCACSTDIKGCESESFHLFLALIDMQLVDIIFHAVVMLCFGCKFPRCHSETLWANCCRCCCTLSSCLTCCLLGGKETIKGDFTDVAVLLSDFFDFQGTLDLVPSDIVAGLLMVKRVQQEYVDECREALLQRVQEIREYTESIRDQEVGLSRLDMAAEQIVSSTPSHLSYVMYRLKRHMGHYCRWEPAISDILMKENLADRVVIAEGLRFMKLSSAVYSWIMYSLNRPYTGFCELAYLSAKESCRKDSIIFPGDSRYCRLHATAFMKESGVAEAEIAYAQFRCEVKGHTPYAIVIDHDWKSVVIVIRGTGSLEDALTDLTLRPVSLKEVGEQCGFNGAALFAHAGMLTSTKWIYTDLQVNGVLNKLLLDTDSKFGSYCLRITGHSLGAGCAAILALMLKPKFPNLRGHCFCPPGCTLSEGAAIECDEYLTSYVNNDDVIPRSSMASLENLRFDVVEMISKLKVPKIEVVCCFSKKYGMMKAKLANARVLYDEFETPHSEFRDRFDQYHMLYQKRKQERDFPDVELFPPGRLIHIVKMSTPTSKSLCHDWFWRSGVPEPVEDEYVSRWATRLDFREIRISPTSLSDHDGVPLLQRLEHEMHRLKAKPYYADVPMSLLQTQSHCKTSKQTDTGSISLRDNVGGSSVQKEVVYATVTVDADTAHDDAHSTTGTGPALTPDNVCDSDTMRDDDSPKDTACFDSTHEDVDISDDPVDEAGDEQKYQGDCLSYLFTRP